MTIAFMRLLHRCEFFKGVEVAKEGLLRQSTMTPCETRCASLFPPSGGGRRCGTIRRNARVMVRRKSALRNEGLMDANDKYACAELIQAWGLYRDQGKWPQLLATFVPEGQIAVSWFSGSFREFVDRCRQSFEAGQRSKHLIFPSVVRLAGDRALAETNIVILVRQKIVGVIADMTSYARFLDRLERRGGRWGIAERAAIYERDRLDPVEPSEAFDKLFAASDLSIYPEAYRYMAARLNAAGRALAPVVHCDGSAQTAQLYARYEAWLGGT